MCVNVVLHLYATKQNEKSPCMHMCVCVGTTPPHKGPGDIAKSLYIGDSQSPICGGFMKCTISVGKKTVMHIYVHIP